MITGGVLWKIKDAFYAKIKIHSKRSELEAKKVKRMCRVMFFSARNV